MRLETYLPAALAGAYALGILAFFVTSRYRLPVVMFMLPLSATGIIVLVDLARTSAWRKFIPTLALGGLVVVLSMWNPFGVGAVADARGEYTLGVDYFRAGDYDRALQALNRSLKEDALFAPGWQMRGRTYDRLGMQTNAIQDLEVATQLDSTLSTSFVWLGVLYQKTGRHQEAEHEYLRAIELDPHSVIAWNNLADVYLRRGSADSALPYLHRALREDSTFVNAIYGLGLYYELRGDRAHAAETYRRALPYPPARARLNAVETHPNNR
jgi:Tfp pilus assembly protein PilF